MRPIAVLAVFAVFLSDCGAHAQPARRTTFGDALISTFPDRGARNETPRTITLPRHGFGDAEAPPRTPDRSWAGGTRFQRQDTDDADSGAIDFGPVSVERGLNPQGRGHKTVYRLKDVSVFGGDVVGMVNGKGAELMLRWHPGE